ncbi:MAG: ORF6N domain-containing protein [Candidatus Marinimicrobia bacterium]|nr:ORF6N domain-containing protein [Candidatus Neomarinimicrobiota bacterium]
MTEKNQIIQIDNIQNRIYTIRNSQVMLDSDLAELYNVSTSRLNEQVKRNINRFPDDFIFQLTDKEWKNLISQNATSSWGGRRKLPNVFTEQGISSLSGVLKSETAIKVNITIMRAFVQMRKFLLNNAMLFQRIETLEIKQVKTENKLTKVLKAIETESIKPKQGIFYDGQVFDAYVFIADLIKSAKKSILLIDNYIDETVLQLFTKRNKNVSVNIYTKNITKILKQDLKKHNSQHPKIKIKQFDKAHDRFLIIDNSELYHFGASLKDLGKKWFAFSKMDMKAMDMIANLKTGDGDE